MSENAQGSATVAYLNPNWLEATASDVTMTTMAPAGEYYNYANINWISPTYTWPTYLYGYQKITLTLSEVEHLRKCAKKDAKLKTALQKIAPHIEVVIDFP